MRVHHQSLLFLLIALQAVMGEETPASSFLFEDDWAIELGLFGAGVDSNIRVDGTNGEIGSEIDFEDDLGLSDRHALFNALVAYTGVEKWTFIAEWFNLERSSSGVLDGYIYWGNTILPVGAEYSGYFDIQVVRFLAGYTVWSNESTSLGVGFGLHGAGVDAGIAAKGIIAGGEFEIENEVSTGAILPLPNFGLWIKHDFSKRLVGSLRVDAFALDLGEYSGNLWSIGLAIRYQAADWCSLGLGLSYFEVNANVNREAWNGRFEFTYYGPRIFAIFTF